MKKIIIILSIVLGLCITIFLMYERIRQLNQELSISQNNTKALLVENCNLDSTSRTLKLTVDHLERSNDSISKVLLNTMKKNHVNQKKISQLQYMLETNFRIDTISFRDTLFVNDIHVDTCIANSPWYVMNLQLDYPNSIIVNPEFTNEYVTMFSYKKETINLPKKFFLWRWFQRKHIVTEVKIVNNNPYSSIDTTRFIDIIKR